MTAPVEDPAGYAGAFEETERRVLAGFRHFFADGDMVRLRRLLAASRYADAHAAEAFRFVFVEQPLAIQRAVFEHLMAIGQFALDDAQALAREFYGPVFLLLLSDVPWEDAEPLIRDHLGRFFSAHAIGAPAGAAAEGGAR